VYLCACVRAWASVCVCVGTERVRKEATSRRVRCSTAAGEKTPDTTCDACTRAADVAAREETWRRLPLRGVRQHYTR
jgi:hypothetical protein